MTSKKMFSEQQKQEIIKYYLDGHSTNQTGKMFNISSTAVFYILKKANIKRRSVAEGTSLMWDNPEFKKLQIEKMQKGNPSKALGKKWTIDYIIKRPNQSGENNHFWKGGKTKLSAQIKNSAEYSFWRMQIFQRDNFTCQHCNARNKKGEKYIFDADHIYPFSRILDDFNISSIEEAISCEQLWDIKNGRVLCRDCHKKTETWGVNTKKNV